MNQPRRSFKIPLVRAHLAFDLRALVAIISPCIRQVRSEVRIADNGYYVFNVDCQWCTSWLSVMASAKLKLPGNLQGKCRCGSGWGTGCILLLLRATGVYQFSRVCLRECQGRHEQRGRA